MSKNINKQIDFNQFPLNKNGHIIWKESIGLTVDFFYYGEKHTIKILDCGKPDKDYVEISVDGMASKIVNTYKVRNLAFDSLFYKPDYFYNVGDIVNGIMILEQLHIQKSNGKGYKTKHYKCRCLIDGYEYVVAEKELKNGRKCPKCVGKTLIVGYNDLASTDPDIIKFLSNKEDGRKYTRCSHKQVWVICPYCGHQKQMRVEELVLKGLSCPKCSDGLSYPNKFAYNVFQQIKEQYAEYQSEYSPDWLGQMRYDNYVVLKNGQKIIIEMDGGFHYNDYGKRSAQNDIVKDTLARAHGMQIVRINCFYGKITERFELVKNGFINNLKQYFDLSNVDWKLAHEYGLSNRLIEVVNYYNEHPFATNQQIADYFHINVVTVWHYLIVGEEIGLCIYVRHDPNRYKTSMPLTLYDPNGNFLGSFISARHMAEKMIDKGFCRGSIGECARLGKPYKGYIIKQITWEEYEQYQNSV